MVDGLSTYALTRRALAILREVGFSVDDDNYLARVSAYHSLCSTWNLSAKLLSTRDLTERFDDHVADALSLAAYVRNKGVSGSTLVDVGAGAGLPSIPLKLLIPEMAIVLIERSDTKATFLRQAIARFELSNAKVVVANYPRVDVPTGPIVYTARAIERSADLDKAILGRLRPGDAYLAQRGVTVANGTHTRIMKVADRFDAEGLRRGTLYIVTR